MDDIIKQLSIQLGKDKRVVEQIVHHPLLFTKHMIEDPNTIRPIMIPFFGKFVFKFGKTIEDKKLNVLKYLSKRTIATRV